MREISINMHEHINCWSLKKLKPSNKKKILRNCTVRVPVPCFHLTTRVRIVKRKQWFSVAWCSSRTVNQQCSGVHTHAMECNYNFVALQRMSTHPHPCLRQCVSNTKVLATDNDNFFTDYIRFCSWTECSNRFESIWRRCGSGARVSRDLLFSF